MTAPIRPTSAMLPSIQTHSQHEVGLGFYITLADQLLESMLDGGDINTGFTGVVRLDVRLGRTKKMRIEKELTL